MSIKQDPTNNLNNVMIDDDNISKPMKSGEHDWLDDNGEPDYHYLSGLVESNKSEDWEKLRNIADDLDIEYEEDTPLSEILDRIRMGVRNE